MISENFRALVDTEVKKEPVNDFSYTFDYPQVFKNFDEAKEKNPNCVGEGAYLYIQYSCEMPTDELEKKHSDLSIISCLAIFAASLYLIVLYFVKRNSKMN